MNVAARLANSHRCGRLLLPSNFGRRFKFEHARFVSRLHRHLSNNDIEGCWDVLDDPPKEFNFSRDIIDFWAAEKQKKRQGDVLGFWFAKERGNEPDIKYTFADLSHLSQRVAGFLKHDLGLDKNSRLLVILPKTPEFWLVLLGAIRCGITLTTCTTMLTAKDIKFRLGKFQPDCIIAGSNEVAAVDEVVGSFNCVQHKVAVSKEGVRNDWKLFDSLLRNSREHEGEATYAEDPAIVFFTSGTTGPPKMVEHAQGYFLAHLSTACHVHSPEQHDIVWCIADPGWAKVAWGTFPTWLMGACFFQAQMPKFLSTATLAVLRDYSVTKLCAPPTVYRALLQQDPSLFQFKSLVDCISAGEPMNPEVMLKWQNLTGIEIREVYGQTETVVLCASPKHHPIKPGSMGIPPRNVLLQIHDEKGREVAVGETGLVAVDISSKRPFGLFAGYRDDPERTANVFRNGFYYTGDRASMDVDGYFWFYSRADDVIISAGYRIGPFEVESVLLEHPAVVECAVVASPDPTRGEVVKAFVVLHPDYKSQDIKCLTEELQQYVKGHTAPYKYPRKVEFVNQLPKTISGKILRHLLREREKMSAEQCR
uniref:medium-chain acyl-CoA ligase n=1 Tax=Rhipicephalus pulchellus TaxID=72859 RepID=L7LYK6_RHIPC